MEVNFERFPITQLAGCTLLVAEAASYYGGKSVLHLDDVTELILVGAFQGISEMVSIKTSHVEEGLIIYLRQAVKALNLVDMTDVVNPLSQTQKTEKSFSPPKPSILRSQSLFRPGFLSVSEISIIVIITFKNRELKLPNRYRINLVFLRFSPSFWFWSGFDWCFAITEHCSEDSTRRKLN